MLLKGADGEQHNGCFFCLSSSLSCVWQRNALLGLACFDLEDPPGLEWAEEQRKEDLLCGGGVGGSGRGRRNRKLH